MRKLIELSRPFALGIICGIFVLTSVVTGDEPSAASLAFTVDDPVVREARTLMDGGNFRAAEELLHRDLDQASGVAKQARLELLEIMARVRYEYSLKPAQLLKKLQVAIPTTTEADRDRWVAESRARTRLIDGELVYFRREPQNIFLFSREAQQRRAAAGKQTTSAAWPLVNHLAKVVAAGEQSSTAEVVPVQHRITHTLTIRPGHPAIKPGAIVRVWLPFAQEYRQQRDVKLISASPEPKLVAPPAMDGSPVTGGAQRTVYFEQVIENTQQPLVFTEQLEFVSYAYYPKLDEKQVMPLPSDWNGADLGERLPHIVFDQEIVAKTREIVGQETIRCGKPA